jgi:hypothetical protein
LRTIICFDATFNRVLNQWKACHETGRLLALSGFFPASTFPAGPTCRLLLAKLGGFIGSYYYLGFSRTSIFPAKLTCRLLAGQTVLAIDIFGPNRGT